MRIRRVTNRIAPRLSRVGKQFDKIKKEAHKKFVDVTPRDTGNAKSRTRLSGSQIQANYDYSVKLENGYSRQAKRGMSRPTIAHIKELIKKI